ncbi:hypothetical protein U1Q18_046045 [Sarracenia purpurea var. burkii]
MMQPATSAVPPPMAPQSVDHQQNHHFQYQQQQQWMMANQQQQPQQQQQQSFQYQPQPPMYYHQQPPPQAAVAAAQPQYAAAQPTSGDEVRTLWIGDLQYWMDEQYIVNCFAHTGEVVSAKIIRNKQSGQSEGYGFVEFVSHVAAERALRAYNGSLMPNVEQNFRLNWASFGVGEKRSDGTPDFTIFVGDLAADVTDYMLQETFRSHFPSVKGAKIVTDRVTGRTKGYGFVKFGDESEQLRAMAEMNGKFCSTRPMRVGPAANKKNVFFIIMWLSSVSFGCALDSQIKHQFSNSFSSSTFLSEFEHHKLECACPDLASYQNTQGTQNEDDPNNTTIFVGGLNDSVSDEQLRQFFSLYGQLLHVKIPPGKRCGFVQFADR